MRDAAISYLGKGWSPIPIPIRSKAPQVPKWQDLRIDRDQIDFYFEKENQNIGILLGEPSAGLVDVDLDCTEAQRLAHLFLPSTLVFGRDGAPRSHWLYLCDPIPRTIKYHVDGNMLVEVRSTGAQTVFPPSIHESGEKVRFEDRKVPYETSGGVIVTSAGKLASAALLARSWPQQEGTRQTHALALAGALYNSGWGEKDVEQFVRHVSWCGGDEEYEIRSKTAATTQERKHRGRTTYGWPKLAELFGEKVVRHVRDWLGVREDVQTSTEMVVLSENLERLAQRVRHMDSITDAQSYIVREIGSILSTTGEGLIHISEAVDEAVQRLDDWLEGRESDVLKTGIRGFDQDIGGLPVSEVSILAAPTGAGKTSLLVQILRQVARSSPEGASCAVFSAEMTREQLVHRTAAAEAKIDLTKLRQGEASEAEVKRYRSVLESLRDLEIYLNDEPSPSADVMFTSLADLAERRKVVFAALDYDEKVDAAGATEELRVSSIIQSMKSMAKHFAVPFLVLSQYSRSADTGLPSDRYLRYSGKKEQEAALILHWHWPGLWVAKGTHSAGEVDGYDGQNPGRGWLIVSKNRFGKTGKVELYFEPEYTRFVDPSDITRKIDDARPVAGVPF